MKLFVVKLRESAPPMWGQINEAVIRAEGPDAARELLLTEWLGTPEGRGETFRDWCEELRPQIQVAEIAIDGPAGIVSGTHLS